MSKSNLRSANLGNAVIQDANFMEADLRNANLADVRLEGTNLIGARLDSAKIENSSFRRADLSAATVSQLTNVDLSEATFTVADLSQSSLMSSKFTDSFLLGADLSEASLDDVDLGGAKLWLSDLSGVDLSGARNLTQSQLDASCIDPRATVRLPAGGDLTTVEAERHFETCRALKADPFKRHALFELLFKLSADASGDRLGFLEERHWGSHKTVEMWLSFQVPAVSDLVNQSVPPTLTRNVGMLGDYLFRKKADAQAAGMPSGGDIGQPVVLSSFTDDEIEVLRSKLCQDPPWAISCLCRKVDEAESRQPGSGESGLCRPGHLPP